MAYSLDVRFEPLHELINSLHTYICRKSHKKIDLTPSWAKEIRRKLSPGLAALLDETEVDADWRCTYLLVHLCPDGRDAEAFLSWLEGLTPGGMYELMSPYTNQFPENMGAYRSKTLKLFSMWNEEYFRHQDPAILELLSREAKSLQAQLPDSDAVEFVDRTTNGLMFRPLQGLEQVILIPQYHFQPVNVIYHFGRVTLCHYAARVRLEDDGFISPHDYRVLRSLGEKSRLKILQYLHQGPRSYTEIVRHLKLSKGITHDHIFKLRSAGLIHAHFEGENLTEYSLRSKAITGIQGRLMEYISANSEQ
jgi:DNA-binding transcriptional ArsR family regulator